jgi:hypothetical protein
VRKADTSSSTYSLLLGQIAGSTENDNDGVVLELHGAVGRWWSAMVDVELALRAVCITNELPLHHCRGSCSACIQRRESRKESRSSCITHEDPG